MILDRFNPTQLYFQYLKVNERERARERERERERDLNRLLTLVLGSCTVTPSAEMVSSTRGVF